MLQLHACAHGARRLHGAREACGGVVLCEPLPPCGCRTRRYRHLCVTPSCLASWEAAGYNRTDVSEYLNATRVVADDPNAALDLRIPQGVRYRCALWAGGHFRNRGARQSGHLATPAEG